MCPEPRDSDPAAERYRALLEVADLMVQRHTLGELLHEIAVRLHRIGKFEFINFSVHDPVKNVMRLHVWASVTAEVPPLPEEMAVEDSVSGWVWQHQQPLIFAQLADETRFLKVVEVLRQQGVGSYCMLPLTTAKGRLGALGFGRSEAGHYTDDDLDFLRTIARLVAAVVESASSEEKLVRERDRLQLLLEVTNVVVSTLDFQELFVKVSAWLRRVFRHDVTAIVLCDSQTNTVKVHALDFPAGRGYIHEALEGSAQGSPSARALLMREAHVYRRSQLQEIDSPTIKLVLREGILSLCTLPLFTSKSNFGALCLGSFEEDAFREEDVTLLKPIAGQVAIALENASAYREIAEVKDKLVYEKLYLENEIRTEQNFEELVGESAALKRVLSQVETVGPSDASVLIQGETGTGKELVARAIHQLSARKNQSFVKINCAAIPSGLLESELFGHERGAFTGALSQKVGRLELANGGTLFLDEVGDIPLELQPKLLRVLQEQEFERLGSNRTIRVNVRLIAATNRELEKLVARREFRGDLYYRIKVFPIHLPALRERREDIPILVRYFTQRFARRMNKVIETIPEGAMNTLMSWNWAGNVRELENLIERSVILTKGTALSVPLSELQTIDRETTGSSLDRMLETAEREQIMRVLRETRGMMSGPSGAAAKLGVKRTTLQSKMRKLGISRHDFLNNA